MKAASVLMILLFSFAVCKSQTATWVYPLTIHIQDSSFKELGYFKWNEGSKTITTRGVQKHVWNYFINEILIPQLEIGGSLQKIADQINEDGSIKNPLLFKEAFLSYQKVKLKYGM